MAGKAAPATYSPSVTTSKTKKRAPFFSGAEWTRPDNRQFHQCRPAYMKTDAVNSASGSAYAEFGSTKVMVSVFGPRESKKAMMYSDVGRLNCNVSYTTFATSSRGQASDDKDFSAMLHKALEGSIILESFPKTTVDVFALVLESGGSDFPVIISCASLALADAGILLYDLVASVSMVILPLASNRPSTVLENRVILFLLSPEEIEEESCIGNNLVIDPVSEEERHEDGSLMITCMPSRNEVTQLTVTGEWSTSKVHEAMGLCLDACSKLGDIMRSKLKEATSPSED